MDNILSFILSTPPEIAQELGKRLRAQRLMQSMAQAELADRAGVSVGTVKNLERKGQASLDSLLRIVAALGLVDALQDLFAPKVRSIAEMERAEQPLRQRAPRQ